MARRAPELAPTTSSHAPSAAVDDSGIARFEEALRELEDIVAQLERGDLRLEDSIRLSERGFELEQQCKGALEAAELKVRNLLESSAPAAAP